VIAGTPPAYQALIEAQAPAPARCGVEYVLPEGFKQTSPSGIWARTQRARIREDAIREQIGQAIEADSSLTRLTADAVSDADIHDACLAVVERSDLSEEQGAAEFRAALAAIRQAEQRLAPAG